MMLSTLAVCMLVAPMGPAMMQDPAAPSAAHVQVVLQAADEASRLLRSARYEAMIEGTGALAVTTPVTTGTVLLQKTEGPELNVLVEGVRYEVDDLQGTSSRFGGVMLDGVARRFDHERKMVVTGGGGMRTLGDGAGLVLGEFNHPAPFRDEIEAAQATLEGRAFVHEVLCDVVLVEYRRDIRARWYFGAEDHLPRRVERLRDVEGEPGAFVITLRHLEPNVEIDESSFNPPAPEGYVMRRAAPGSGIQGVRAVRIRDPDDDRR